jgi:hypothetical protein
MVAYYGMSVIGVVEDGKVVLPPGTELPTGTRVRVEPLISEQRKDQSLREALGKFIGIADDVPDDLAQNHDHYIHGTAKK